MALLSPACSAPLYVQELCSFVQKIPPFHCVIIDQNPTDRFEANDFRKKTVNGLVEPVTDHPLAATSYDWLVWMT